LNSEKIGKIWKKSKLKSEKIRKIWKKIVKRYEKYGKYGRKVFFFYKTINTACNLFKFTLCPTVRGNNSVSEGITL
jgi:aryl-phospho-beta-D-glucosidase BglC (GH1 family)